MHPKTGPDAAARRRILDHLRAHPGLPLGALADALGMPASTLAYHCRVLERTGQVATRCAAGRKAYYPAEGIDRRDRDILHLVVRAAPRTICLFLLEHPGSTPGDLRRALAVSGPALSFHLGRLRAAHLVTEQPHGRTKRLYVGDANRVAHVLAAYPEAMQPALADEGVHAV